MSEEREENGNTSIAARIAALKLDHVGRQPGEKPAPKVPNKRPELPSRQQSTNVPPVGAHASAADAGHDIGNQPATNGTNGVGSRAPPALPNRPVKGAAPVLPPRRPSAQTPQLPPRRPSESPSEVSRPDINRKLSSESTVSTRSGLSSKTSNSGPLYTIRAPSFDPSTLPPLPSKRTPSLPERGQIPLLQSKSSPNVLPAVQEPLRPQLPSRDSSSQSVTQDGTIKPPPPKRSALSWGLNASTEKPPNIPTERPSSAVPPPIPTGSRPDLSKLLASKPNIATNGAANGTVNGAAVSTAPAQGSCLKCRDFSMVDAHAARFPRQSLPSQDLGWLANSLTSPFPSLTDKARAIFVWLHHNIDYNTHALYTNTVKGSTPASTLATGLAVCEGYAGLFTALASKVGLESMVVGGHGKGAGFEPVAPGAPLPPEDPSGHAWNVVKIDNGQWKLIDCCWGAGHIGAWGTPYQREFHPIHFYSTNEEFGRSHFPSNKNHFFRTDGRQTITWAEYLLGETNGREAPQTFGNMTTDEGIDDKSMKPAIKQISVNDPQTYVRFQCNKICPHWDIERNGKGKHYLYLLFLPAANGRDALELPLQTNGQFWWVDVPTRELGEPGQEVKLGTLTKYNGNDARGMQASDFVKKGGCSWAFAFAAVWQLVG